jgi:beta-lactamase regulating signal transducer with metallopeptidase domain
MIGLIAAHGSWEGLAQAATGSLVSAIWQGVLLASAAALGLKLLPKTPAAIRFAIWFAVFTVVCALPAVEMWPHAVSAGSGVGHGAWLTLDARWSLAIATVWAAVSLVRAGTLVVAAFRVRALWRRAEPVEFAEETALCGRRAKVCVSDEVDRPSVIGFFSPKILIPRWLLEKLTPVELRQIVLHEAGHLGRADDWMNLLQKLALVVFPLNPALVWVERHLCFERELACDERVLQATNAPKAYAACLATLAEHRIGRRALALSLGALGRESELGKRVRRILWRGERMRPVRARLVLGAAMLALVVGAVELGRCPQVVAFSATHAQAQDLALAAPARPKTEQPYRFDPVVFRPDAASGVKPEQNLVARPYPSKASARAVRATPAARQPAVRLVRDVPSDGLDQADSARRDSVAAWIVVTSWRGEQRAQVVFATEDTSADTRGDTSPRPISDEQAPAEQVHPYAAVPLRGGWLVFQL